MGRINVVLTDDTEHRLRKTIVDAYGGKKGDLSEAIEQAINDWIARYEKKREK